VMDHILGNKAVFKSATDAIGNVALVGGAAMAMSKRTDEAGLGLAAFGLLSKLVSAATTPRADTRCWDNLPQYLSFGVVQLPPGDYQAAVEFQDDQGRTISGMTRNLLVRVSSTTQDTVVFLSDQPS